MATINTALIEPTSNLVQIQLSTGTTSSSTAHSFASNAFNNTPTVNNYMVVVFTFSDPLAAAATVTTPAGWTIITSGNSSTKTYTYAYYRKVVLGDTGAVNLSVTTASVEALNYSAKAYEITGANGTFNFNHVSAASNNQSVSVTPGIADVFQIAVISDIGNYTYTLTGGFFVTDTVVLPGGSEPLYTQYIAGPTIYTTSTQTLATTGSGFTDPLLFYICIQLSSNPTQTTDALSRSTNYSRTYTDTSNFTDSFSSLATHPRSFTDTVTTLDGTPYVGLNYFKGLDEPTSTLIQKKKTEGTTASGTSLSLTTNAFSATPTNGNSQIVIFTFSNSTGSAPVVTAPTGFSLIGNAAHGSGIIAYAYSKTVVSGDTGVATLGVTVSSAQALNYSILMFEVTGQNGTFQFKSAGAASSTQTASLTPGLADCFQIAAIIDSGHYSHTYSNGFYEISNSILPSGSSPLYADFLLGPTIYDVAVKSITSTASGHILPLLVYILIQLNSNPTQTTDSITQRLVDFNRFPSDTSIFTDSVFRGTVKYPLDTMPTVSDSLARLIDFNRLPVAGLFALSQYQTRIETVSSLVNYFPCNDASPGPLVDYVTGSTLAATGITFQKQQLTPGKFDYSIEANANSNSVSGTLSNLSTSPFTSSSNFSIGLWVILNTTQIFTGTDATPILAGIFNNAGTQFSFYIGFLSNNNTSLGVYFQDSVSGSATLLANTTINVPANAAQLTNDIYHIVFTYNGSTKIGTIYVNGIAVNSGSLALPNGLNPGSLLGLISGLNAQANSIAKAYVNNVAIYDAVLSPNAIANHYNLGAGSIAPVFTNTAFVTGVTFTESESRNCTYYRNNTPYWSAVVANAPTFFYRTNEQSGIVAFDSSGTPQNGTYSNVFGSLFGVTLYQPGPSLGNFTVYFDGISGNINTAYIQAANSSIFTTEIYWKPSSLAANQTISATASTTTSNTGFWIYTNSLGGISVNLGYNTGFTTINSNTLISLSTWYHIALTVSGSTVNLYINGVLDTTQTIGGTYKSSTNHFQFGSLPVNNTNYGNGYYGGISFHSGVALTAAQITIIYTALYAPNTDVLFTSDLESNYSNHPRSFTDTLNFSDLSSRVINFYRMNDDIFTTSDLFAAQNNYARMIAEAFYYFQGDMLTNYAVHDRTAGPDIVSSSDLLASMIDFNRTNINITLTYDQILSSFSAFRYLDDIFTTTPDAISSYIERFRNLSNTFVHTTFLTSQGIYYRTNTDTSSFTDVLGRGVGEFIFLSDSFSTSDLLSSQNIYIRNSSDIFTFFDELISYRYFSFDLTDTFGTSDLIIQKYVYAPRINNDTFETLDNISRILEDFRTSEDDFETSDSILSFADIYRILVDVDYWIYLTTVQNFNSYLRTNAEDFITFDIVMRNVDYQRMSNDIFLTSDIVFKEYEYFRELIDYTEISDSTNRSAIFNRTNVDVLDTYNSLVYVNINGYMLNDIVTFDFGGARGQGTIVEVIYDKNQPHSYHYKIDITTSSDWSVYNGSTSFVADFTEIELISRYS